MCVCVVMSNIYTGHTVDKIQIEWVKAREKENWNWIMVNCYFCLYFCTEILFYNEIDKFCKNEMNWWDFSNGWRSIYFYMFFYLFVSQNKYLWIVHEWDNFVVVQLVYLEIFICKVSAVFMSVSVCKRLCYLIII